MGGEKIKSLEQQLLIGRYYNKLFNDFNIDVKDIAVYLKEISRDKNLKLYSVAEKVHNGDMSDMAVADMMLSGMEQCQNSQKTVYTKIGEQLNLNNKYTINELLRQYEILNKKGIKFSKNIRDTYNELSNAEEIGRNEFNYLVGKLSATMDAVAPRASIANEFVKRIKEETNKGSIDKTSGNKNIKNSMIDENAVIDGMWEDAPNTSKYNVEKSGVENLSDDDIIKKAKEYLQSSEGQQDKRPYLWHRPSFGKNQEQIVYDNGKNFFGNVYDPSGVKILWDLSKPRKGQWDMGHIPGQKYSVIHAKYVTGMMTSKEFLQWYRNPQNYRPELPSTNRSHKYE